MCMLHTNKRGNQVKNSSLTLPAIDGLTVEIIPNKQHEFLMTTEQVAMAYGIAPVTLRRHRQLHDQELKHGVHYLSIVVTTSTGGCRKTAYTKQGVIRLGMFIKSERAVRFRDWAEQLILDAVDKKVARDGRMIPTHREHNRLTPLRIIDILADVIQIEDHALRQSIAEKLIGKGGQV